MRKIFLWVLALSLSSSLSAQEYSLSSNVLELANFVTFDLGASVSVARHWSVDAGVRYNPFKFKDGDMVAKQRCAHAGVRYWPWHVYSGWWAAAALQYQEYDIGGIVKRETREGNRYGASFSGGYSYMISPHFNLDFGLGFWSGYDDYTVYECPVCGITKRSGKKVFILPDEIRVAFSYIF